MGASASQVDQQNQLFRERLTELRLTGRYTPQEALAMANKSVEQLEVRHRRSRQRKERERSARRAAEREALKAQQGGGK